MTVRDVVTNLLSWLPGTWEQYLAVFSILLVLGSTAFVLVSSPNSVLKSSDNQEVFDESLLRQGPRFYVNYQQDTTWETTVTTSRDEFPNATPTPSNGTADANESRGTVATNESRETPDGNESLTTSTRRSREAPRQTAPTRTTEANQSSEVQRRPPAITVTYTCTPITTYLREGFYDYRCWYNDGTILNPRTLENLSEENSTTVSFSWRPEEGEPITAETPIVIRNQRPALVRKSFALKIPPAGAGGVANYTLRVNASDGEVWLSRPIPEQIREKLYLSSYEQNISSRLEEIDEQKLQKRIQRETRLFRWLGLVILWIGGIQLALAALTHKNSKE